MDTLDAKLSSADSSDREGDTFEDAPDSVQRQRIPHTRSRSNASARSLTDRSSTVSAVRSLTDRRDSSSTPVDRRPSNLSINRRPSSSSLEATPRASKIAGTTRNERDITDREDMIGNSGDEEQANGESKSPLLTARRVSTFDEVQLSEMQENGEARGRSITVGAEQSERSGSRSSVSAKRPQIPNRASTVSNAVPSAASTMGAPPLPPRSHVSTAVSSTPVSRKLSSPFSWLSRKKSTPQGPQGSTSPPQTNFRRHTATSVGTVGSNPDMMLSRLDEEKTVDHSNSNSRLPARESLKERFKLLRIREEAGINIADVEQDASTNPENGASVGNVGLGIGASRNALQEEEDALVVSPEFSTQNEIPTSLQMNRKNSAASNIDPNLAPGTVSGISTGPSAMQDPEAPVDWDLWQSVVYEGPAAVAKTSAAELSRAIASGIPSAIRGVVWQVLAQSKNEELEGVYRDLIIRGTDKERERDSPVITSGPHSANSIVSNGTYKESIASSASSVHSENSTPATTNGMTSPVAQDTESNASKLQAAMNAERQKRAKDDLSSLKKLEKTIRKDLGTRSNYSKYAASPGLQESLFGVCKAYALFDEAVGYTQGMNFIVMPLLFNMSEGEAFCLLVRLMNQYQLRDMFTQDMPGLHLHLYQFERLLEDVEPALCYHLHKRGINPSVYATQWFLTLFAYRFPLQLVLRVYDLILSEGLEGAILKFGIALVQKNAETLLGMQDMSALKIFLNERLFDVYIDQAPSASSILESGFFGNSGGMDKEVYRADLLVQDACAVKITPELLKAYTTDYETRMRLEKEREAEFEALRSSNVTFALKIRSLEERAEKSDTDHVQMATEMIRSKMENEELRTTNTELEAEITVLKKTVASQPAEVEEKLREEMERIMQRNIEVQNENRAIEEQMAEMEQDLVSAKLRLAEINADHDALKQRWSDLRKALGD